MLHKTDNMFCLHTEYYTQQETQSLISIKPLYNALQSPFTSALSAPANGSY
jgi:hypothetical protein